MQKLQWNNIQGILQFAIYITILLLGIGGVFTAYGERINTLEKQTKVYQTDHDILISVDQKVTSLIELTKEIKSDLKGHLIKK